MLIFLLQVQQKNNKLFNFHFPGAFFQFSLKFIYLIYETHSNI